MVRTQLRVIKGRDRGLLFSVRIIIWQYKWSFSTGSFFKLRYRRRLSRLSDPHLPMSPTSSPSERSQPLSSTVRTTALNVGREYMDPRMKMTSGFGLLSIDEGIGSTLGKTKATIAMDPTGELTPAGSACEGDYEDDVGYVRKEGELTRTLSALQRLSVEERTTLQRKLREQQQSSREPADPDRANKEDSFPIAPDSPYRVILQKAVVEGDLEAAAAALRSGADPNERDELRHSSLHFAAAKGDIGCLQELMNSGARANVANNVRPYG